jgi:hypothetical protein
MVVVFTATVKQSVNSSIRQFVNPSIHVRTAPSSAIAPTIVRSYNPHARMLDGILPPLIVLVATAAVLALRARRSGRSPQGDATTTAGGVFVVVLALTLELAMGRPAAYRNGPVRAWSGDVKSDQNSQQLADPYSLTHVIHGTAFYALTRLARPSAGPAAGALLTLGLESAWEVFENTDTVINRYRTTTVSLGYYGDSVFNSLGDIISCLVGFLLAWRLPARVTLLGVAAIEIGLLAWIRDNLTLNIVMLLYPIDPIRVWQAGGAGF